MELQTYQRKRDFDQTPEPKGRVAPTGQQRFVVQEHHASQLHYDFRLEIGGVLASWAIPKGPSLDPSQKRLAVRVEDHPLDYVDFEGHISEGNYGAGDVVIWDSGDYELVEGDDAVQQLEAGKLTLQLNGEKLQGQFALIQMHGPKRDKQWLLIKKNDNYAQKGWELEPLLTEGTAKRDGRTNGRARARPAAKKPTAKRPIARAGARSNVAGKRAGSASALPAVPGAEAASMPETLRPMLATLVDAPFSKPDWVYETKWDGVRAVAFLTGGQVRLISRNNKELGLRYPELADLAKWVQARHAILDGEIVVLEDGDRSNFQRLQARLGLQDKQEIERLAAKSPVTYVVFDLVYYDGFDLRRGELLNRKALLQSIIQQGSALRLSEHVVGEGEKAFQQAQAAGQEGIVAKRQDSPYMEGRSGAWLKIKALLRQEVVIGGYTQPRNTRQYLGALVTGLYRGDKLHYVGHVGGGFDRQSLAQVFELLQPLKTKRSPFMEAPQTNEAVQWLRPERVAEVKFAAWTTDNRLRQPIFLGLRDDKNPKECTFERPAAAESAVKKAASVKRKPMPKPKASPSPRAKSSKGSAANQTEKPVAASQAFGRHELSGDLPVLAGKDRVELTHLDRVYWPTDGYTKADLLRYYWDVSSVILPYLKDRPLILKRHPNGFDQPAFFQHNVEDAPGYAQTFSGVSEEGRHIQYVVCQNRATLLYLVNLGTLAQNPWQSRVGNLDHPDWIVFDLDPGRVGFDVVCEVALALKSVLDQVGLASYAKTSGSRGLHVYIPIKAIYPYQQVASLAERVARLVADQRPDIATVERSKKSRPDKKVYVDFLQNARGKSVASAYSVRAHAGATVSAPLDWREVKRCPDLQAFTIKTMARRLAQKGDLFRPVLTKKQALQPAIEKLGQLAQAG